MLLKRHRSSESPRPSFIGHKCCYPAHASSYFCNLFSQFPDPIHAYHVVFSPVAGLESLMLGTLSQRQVVLLMKPLGQSLQDTNFRDSFDAGVVGARERGHALFIYLVRAVEHRRASACPPTTCEV